MNSHSYGEWAIHLFYFDDLPIQDRPGVGPPRPWGRFRDGEGPRWRYGATSMGKSSMKHGEKVGNIRSFEVTFRSTSVFAWKKIWGVKIDLA